jgi:hypothetical protein
MRNFTGWVSIFTFMKVFSHHFSHNHKHDSLVHYSPLLIHLIYVLCPPMLTCPLIRYKVHKCFRYVYPDNMGSVGKLVIASMTLWGLWSSGRRMANHKNKRWSLLALMKGSRYDMYHNQHFHKSINSIFELCGN